MKPRERRYLGRLIGESAQGRGRVSEESLLAAVKKVGCEFSWFLWARQAYADEDSKGIDIAVHVRGWSKPLYLQCKSSHTGAKEFASRRRKDHVEVVVVHFRDEITQIRAREALERGYAKATCVCGIDVGAQAPSRA